MWKEDSKVDRIELGNAALHTQELHSKYIDIYFYQRTQFLKAKEKYARLKMLRYEYWMGILPIEDLKENNWPPQPKKITKQELEMYMDADPVLNEALMQMNLKQEKLNVLDQILKTISQRGFQINSAINWVKFTSGQ